jgi:hypothetical protein
MGASLAWFFRTVPKARFNGDYRRTPFFRADTGAPIVAPQVLTSEEHGSIMSSVRAATG